MEYLPVLNRPALGTRAVIGQLYNARLDKFMEGSVFQNTIPNYFIKSTEEFIQNVQTIKNDALLERFQCLEIYPELQTSIIAGLVEPKGSGMFLDLEEQTTSARAVNCSFLYSINTVTEELDLTNGKITDEFKTDGFENATHLVVGISWGANTIVSCSGYADENCDTKAIINIVQTSINRIIKNIFGESSKAGTCVKEMNKLEVRMYGDILPNASNDLLTSTVEEAQKTIGKILRLIKETEDNKGKPVFYKLIPISFLNSYFPQLSSSLEIKAVDEASLLRVVRYFDQAQKTKQLFNDFHKDVLNHLSCVPPNELSEILSLKEKMEQDESKFRSELSTLIISIRSGESDVEEIDKLLQKFKDSAFSSKNLEMMLKGWQQIQGKIRFEKHLNLFGGKYLGFHCKFSERKLKNEGKHVIFYFSMPTNTEDKQLHMRNRQAFLQELHKCETGSYYYAVDCEFHPELLPDGKPSIIKVIQNGKILYQDFLTEIDKMPQAPMAYGVEGLIQSYDQPRKRAPLLIPCTGINCNQEREYDWICKNCSAELQWGFDEHVYCTCGKTPVTSLVFKCTDETHQQGDFEKHDETHLQNVLQRLMPSSELNILIMGETGVGKSTWINSFINLLNFDTLEKAEAQSQLLSLIPAQFTVYNEDFQEVKVCTGVDDNEAMKDGQSSTQGAKVYSFRVGNTVIRLIDTPGIGDTRGVHQDKLNFKNILDTVEHLNDLHGICILLKPNNSKVNVMFRFCIKELLTHLHKDASTNIMFCFTNSRGTFYRPGDTMPALRALLTENQDVGIELTKDTIYCFDSEAYRFLAAIKNDPPVSFPEEERENFAKSWEKSITETNRMLAYIRSLRPHPVKSTLNLNHARDMVLKLTRPLAEISRNIQINKSIVEDEKARIEKTDEDIRKLEGNLMTERTEIEVVPISFPKTVCSNSDCVKVWNMAGGRDLKTIEYVQVCHPRCRLKGVARDTVGDVGLMECWAIKDGNCRHSTCGHSYREHLHIYYESRQVLRKVEDQTIKSALKSNLTAKDLKLIMIKEKSRLILEFENELKTIQDASIRFAHFLKRNAIAPYNDAMEEYLDHLIQEEKNKVYHGGTRVTLNGLKATKESYLMEKKVLEEAMAKGDENTVITPSEINDIVEKLKGLKHSGESLQDALNCVRRTAQHVHTSTTVHNSSGMSGSYAGAAYRATIYVQSVWETGLKVVVNNGGRILDFFKKGRKKW